MNSGISGNQPDNKFTSQINDIVKKGIDSKQETKQIMSNVVQFFRENIASTNAKDRQAVTEAITKIIHLNKASNEETALAISYIESVQQISDISSKIFVPLRAKSVDQILKQYPKKEDLCKNITKNDLLSVASANALGKANWFSNYSLSDFPQFQNDRSVVIALVKLYGTDLQYASETLKKDPEVIEAAIKNDPNALRFAPKEIKNDKNLISSFLNINSHVAKHIGDSLKDDPEFILDMIKERGCTELLEHSTEKVKNNPSVAFATLISDPDAFYLLGNDIKNNSDLKAVSFLLSCLKDKKPVDLSSAEAQKHIANLDADTFFEILQTNPQSLNQKPLEDQWKEVHEKPAAKPEVMPEPKPEPKIEPKVEAKPEPKPEPKIEPKLETKPEAKPDPKADEQAAEAPPAPPMEEEIVFTDIPLAPANDKSGDASKNKPESAAPKPESAAPKPETAAPKPESAAPKPEQRKGSSDFLKEIQQGTKLKGVNLSLQEASSKSFSELLKMKDEQLIGLIRQPNNSSLLLKLAYEMDELPMTTAKALAGRIENLSVEEKKQIKAEDLVKLLQAARNLQGTMDASAKTSPKTEAADAASTQPLADDLSKKPFNERVRGNLKSMQETYLPGLLGRQTEKMQALSEKQKLAAGNLKDERNLFKELSEHLKETGSYISKLTVLLEKNPKDNNELKELKAIVKKMTDSKNYDLSKGGFEAFRADLKTIEQIASKELGKIAEDQSENHPLLTPEGLRAKSSKFLEEIGANDLAKLVDETDRQLKGQDQKLTMQNIKAPPTKTQKIDKNDPDAFE